MHHPYKLFSVFGIAICSLSCSVSVSTTPATAQNGSHDFTRCTEPRPEICTREYNPVCATLNTGKEKTYATGCTACANPAVTKYRQGPCE